MVRSRAILRYDEIRVNRRDRSDRTWLSGTNEFDGAAFQRVRTPGNRDHPIPVEHQERGGSLERIERETPARFYTDVSNAKRMTICEHVDLRVSAQLLLFRDVHTPEFWSAVEVRPHECSRIGVV